MTYLTASGQFLPGDPVTNARMGDYIGRLSPNSERLGRLTLRQNRIRTRHYAMDADGNPLPDSERLTRFGQFLRSSSIDELPEFWNILRGEMSLVGPRPLLMEYLPLYSAEQARRHDVRPGLTGYAQIRGRNALTWPEKFALDTWYVENRSFALDLKILVETAYKVVRREGIAAAGEATMTRFEGNGDHA